MKPLISVIIPSHNCAQTIETAIQSILNQTWKNLEVIVIDDGSTDGSEKIVRNLASRDERVRYFALPWKDPRRINWRGVNINAGYMARNYGFEQARGEWITFQDADDASLLNRIEVQYDLAQKYDALHVSIQWQQLRPELVGKKLDVGAVLRERSDIVVSAKETSRLAKETKGILMGNWFPHGYVPFIFKWFHLFRPFFFKKLDPYPGTGGAVFVHRSVLEKIKYRQLDERIWPSTRGRGADRDFNFQVAETFGKSFAFNLPLYLWRVRGQNPMFSNDEYDKYIIR
ncbi:MAG: glycosyltransferase family 2 protein [Candidatus Taylorbacteria bacterium]|nr:glycosyltransferase family 2 protein [Candidatus Taylorbacteria bacterium]